MSLMLWYSWGKPREKGAVMSGSEESVCVLEGGGQVSGPDFML